MTATTEPLHHALLDQARADAERILEGADARAAGVAEHADAQAAAILDEARADGAAAASLEGAQERAAAQRHARALILEAQRQLWDELGDAARLAVHGLRGTPAYDALLERLAQAARGQLGDAAVLDVDPPGRGGLIAVAGGRRVDYTLDALVGRCLQQRDVGELWR